MNDIRIRKAKSPADVSEVLNLKLEVSTILLTRLGHTLEEIAAWHNRFATEEYVKQHMRAPHTLFVMEEFDENEVAKTVAMAGLTIKDDGDNSYAYFGNSYCLNSSLGYGSRLMEYRLGVVENFNVDYIECYVHSGNERGRRFIEHYGFEEFGTRRDVSLGCLNIVYRRDVE